ncbi:methionine--tRNA ligase [Cryobacterium sp. MDB1-18-2]|uniref:Methionine--tRNA ligase n=1 Tax=Cryobacterium glucosi TaxID=1259175 RepID=A0ABY2IMS5_9MICO|nr:MULTISPECIES: methionine--tRNA ligase [Cryobacterium]TFC17902.1 methionine--tRNA ligase [Cryobacterium glucosi]TFC34832.1 methionine--tRNA ligase [Cryobacterium sp. MDB1-18-2]TFC37367.1 methionine--tRNA ligase [Cryobacterium sp. MDB1-18-1]
MSAGASFYITTPIFYVNDVPHIGHAYTEVAADLLARWHRQAGEDAWLLTGTDEHGQKILRTATANGVTPKEWADRLVETAWKPLLKTVDIRNDDFIRTTDERHEVNAQKFLQHLYDAGHIYTGEYEGFYCVGCEEYKQPSDLIEGTGEFIGQQVCAIHSLPVELLHEKNYFFRMSTFAERLLALYEEDPDFVQPESARNEVISFVKQGLSDLSISRSSFDWGIKVPWDDSHVVYVWFDALLNYITAAGYGQDDERFSRLWPATHIVGKDILRFHAVIWPAMLMAAGLPVPRRVFGHGWLLVGGEKMSKSKLTGIAPSQITDTFGSDAFRYYFMRAISFGQDGSFSWEDLSARYQSELANGFGNLASRVIAMVVRYCDGEIPVTTAFTEADAAIRATEIRVTDAAGEAISRLAIHEAIASVWELVDELNGYITSQEPWGLAKDPADRDRLDAVLFTAVRGLGTLAVLLSPVVPEACAKLWSALGGEGLVTDQRIDRAWEWTGGTHVSPLEALFPRIEATVG